jgi:hypothetical protein
MFNLKGFHIRKDIKTFLAVFKALLELPLLERLSWKTSVKKMDDDSLSNPASNSLPT